MSHQESDDRLKKALEELALAHQQLQDAHAQNQRLTVEHTHALQQHDGEFKTLTDSMPQFVWISDLRGENIYFNQRWVDYTGMTVEESKGLGWVRAFHPDDRQFAGDTWTKALKAGALNDLECRIRRTNGEYRWFVIKGLPQLDSAGNPTKWLGTCTDIHMQKEAEEAQRRQQTQLRVLFDLIPAFVWFKDTQNRILRINQVAARAAGKSVEEIEGRPAAEIYPDNADRFYADDLQVIASKAPKLGYEEALGIPGEEEHWVRTDKVPYCDKEGNVIGIVVLARDITAERKAQEEMRNQEVRFASVFEGSRDSILLVSDKGIFDSNKRALELFGYASKSELIGLHPAHLSPPFQPDGQDSLTKSNEYISRAFTQGSCRFEWTHKRRNGEEFPAEVHLSAYEYDGHVVIQGTTHDISERKRAQEALRDASRLAGMAEVATNVLHNVGNVLNSVNISATVLMDHIQEPDGSRLAKVVAVLREHEKDMAAFIASNPQGRQLVPYLAQLAEHETARQQAALDELKSLQRNIEHIKTIVAMQQSYAKVSGTMETIHLQDLVRDSVQINSGALSRHEVQVVQQFDAIGPMRAQKHKILQILVNLVRNAEQACVESGRQDKKITLGMTSDSNRVKLVVSDNGVGIPQENLLRIFNQGFTTKKDGHGFGLHSAAIAAKEMGGSLVAQSPGPGGGATFTLELPLKPQQG